MLALRITGSMLRAGHALAGLSMEDLPPAPDSFATTEVAVDRHVLALAALADANHDYTDAKVLQYWVSDIIEHLEALPAPIQMALGLPLFKIGYEHFWWGADQIKHWYKERCRCLRGQLSELQREQWLFPVRGLPSRFGMSSY
jgi:hypothetical protein